MTKLEFLDRINDILIGLNTAESDALGSLYDELMRSQWIPVEEELPKKDGKYLFYDEVLGHEVSIYYDGVTLVPSITHWMPLPEAPRKEDKE